jgi:hypothetical protein
LRLRLDVGKHGQFAPHRIIISTRHTVRFRARHGRRLDAVEVNLEGHVIQEVGDLAKRQTPISSGYVSCYLIDIPALGAIDHRRFRTSRCGLREMSSEVRYWGSSETLHMAEPP